jgi:glycosyltransferase involved in cell wall biosynthesis
MRAAVLFEENKPLEVVEVDLADPLDVDAIADALRRSLERPDSQEARSRRRASVADLTWRQCALDHLAGWRCE